MSEITTETVVFDHTPPVVLEEPKKGRARKRASEDEVLVGEVVEAKKTRGRKGAAGNAEAVVVPAFPYTFIVVDDQYQNVPPDMLLQAPFDSRSGQVNIKDPAFIQLKKAIETQGVLQPAVATMVRTPDGEERLMLIAGRRRTRACKELGIEVPVHIMPMDLSKALLACGAENIAQKSLTFYDQAVYYSTLVNEHKLEQKDVAIQLGVTDSQISQYLAVFDMCDVAQLLVRDGSLAGTAARFLPKVKDEDQQAKIAQKAVEKGWTLKQIEEEVDKVIQRNKDSKAKKAGASEEGEEAEPAKKAADALYTPEEIHPLKKNQFVELANLSKKKLAKAEEVMPDEYTSDDTVEAYGKLQYAKGFSDAMKLAVGIKPLPKSLVKSDPE